MNELRYLRAGRRHVLRVVTPVALALSGPLLAGCSADITRFDNPSFAFNDSTGSVERSSSGGYGATNLSDQSPGADYGRSYTGPVTSSEPNVRSARLPDVAQSSGNNYRDQQPSYSSRGNNNYADSGYRAPSSQPQYDSSGRSSSQTIVVQSGDTLYGLSRRHGVELSELMSANGLTSSQLHPGQRLTLPGGGSAAPRSYDPPARTASVQQPSYRAPATPPATAQSDWGGSYTVASGDSLYNIARRHGTTTSELQRHNGISDPRRVMPGTVLKVPGYGAGSSTLAQTRPEPQPQRVASLDNNYTRTDATPAAGPAPTSNQASQMTQPRGVRTVSIAPPTQTQAQASDSASSASKLRWPVRGRVIDNFGPRSDGTHNDGVNLAVPSGTDVHAAEEGVVAYAGSELRGYGNLILLRHSNGWVTAYAHNDAVNVKRGDKVTRGQVIAKAGKTGQVDQPQLHFELRMGSKPVDPLPYLETL